MSARILVPIPRQLSSPLRRMLVGNGGAISAATRDPVNMNTCRPKEEKRNDTVRGGLNLRKVETMIHKFIELRACYEALRAKPLPPYGKDPFFDFAVIRRRIGQIIAEGATRSLRRLGK
jgi:hypothetical protein